MLEEHQPTVIEDFNGYWKRGDPDSVPIDHFSETNNIQYIESGFRTRDGLDTFLPRGGLVKIYTFNGTAGEGLLALDNAGNFWHIIPEIPSYFNFLTVVGANTFKFVTLNNFVFINPMNVPGSLDDFIYVYSGNGTTPARKAGGKGPINADGVMSAANGAAGSIELGIHIFGVVYETASGFLTQIGPDTLTVLNATGAKKANLTSVPVSSNPFVTKRHIVSTIAIDPLLYTGDTRGYQFFFVPGGVIPNNTATSITVDFFDNSLLADASHLLDLLFEIPCGNAISTYHGRMVLGADHSDNSIIRISYPGEPEAFDAVNGLQVINHNGFGITNFFVLRDVLYVTRLIQTFALPDNGDVPSSWPLSPVDEGTGAGLFGVATLNITVGGVYIEYVVLINLNGITIFTGSFLKPELSWKVWKFWIEDTSFPEISDISEVYVDNVHKMLYVLFPSMNMIFFGDWVVEFDYTKIRWGKWTFDKKPKSMTLFGRDPILAIIME